MELEISPVMFEWLLADWAGYADRPEAVFPDLVGINRDSLADELESSLREKLLGRDVETN